MEESESTKTEDFKDFNNIEITEKIELENIFLTHERLAFSGKCVRIGFLYLDPNSLCYSTAEINPFSKLVQLDTDTYRKCVEDIEIQLALPRYLDFWLDSDK